MSCPSANAVSSSFNRRRLMLGGGASAAALAAYPVWKSLGGRERVFVARHQRYEGAQLVRTIRDGLLATGIDSSQVDGRRVLLKPNLVEPTRDCPHMTTHPAMVLAVAEVFRSWGAEVTVGEGPGHLRDTEAALFESGVYDALHTEKLPFADLNYEDVSWVKNRGRVSALPGFYLPRSVIDADLVVSVPKMKTHHWVGVTAAMKNLYGVIPGSVYGWPKNVLHHNGIPETVFDINASLPRTIAIVDAIDCMEGDGPIMGSLKRMGLVLVGSNPTAVDATVSRLMGLAPDRIGYLQLAKNRLGPLCNRRIKQVGEAWQPSASDFAILDRPHLRDLRAGNGPLVT